jgi:anti-sigma factor RsiW
MTRRRKVVCTGFVEQVTDYLDGAGDPEERERIDRHVAGCPDCARVLEQWRVTIELVGHLADHDVEVLAPATRARLLAAFRAGPPAPD